MAELPKIPPRLPGGNYPRADALEAHLQAARAELDTIKRSREQERNYADVCYENQKLRELVAGFKELLDLDPENRPGTDLYDLMLQAAEIRPLPHSAEHPTCDEAKSHDV